jgi:hypothetical protein
MVYRVTAIGLLFNIGCGVELGAPDEEVASSTAALAASASVAGKSVAPGTAAPAAGALAQSDRTRARVAGGSAAPTPAAVAGAVNKAAPDTRIAGQPAGSPAPLASTPAPVANAPAALAVAPSVAVPSARREPAKDWKEYAELAKTAARANTAGRAAVGGLTVASVYDSRVAVASASLANVPVWSDADIWAQFRASRDARHMPNSGYVRRPTWMYPDDGCWIRAELAAIAATEAGKPKPYKLFSFGSLNVSTTNAPGGSVSWWYHVVPVVKSASTGQAYVLDAAIDPTQPLPWQTWLLRQVPTLSSVQVTFADSGAYGPFDPVTGGVTPAKPTVVSDMQGYMGAEWSRQVSLGRDPVTVLGYFPPWSNVGKDFNQDRRSDIVWHHGGSGDTQVWYMNGTTRTGYANLPYNVSDASGWKFAGNGDFNRDGKTDIVWHHGVNGTTQVWYMDGLTRLSWANLSNTVPLSSGWVFAGADDFNYDGKTDIMWHNGSTGYTQVWYLNDSLGLIAWPNLAPGNLVTDASGWRLAGTGDFNRDGRTDVIWRHGASGTMQFWYLDGVNLASWANLPYTVADSSGWRFFSAREFNYDGKTDIVWQHGGLGTIQNWYMDGLTRTSYANLPYTVADSSGWFTAGY